MIKTIFIYLVATFAGSTYECSETQQTNKPLKYVAKVATCDAPANPKSYYNNIPEVGDTVQYSPDRWCVIRSYDWWDKSNF